MINRKKTGQAERIEEKFRRSGCKNFLEYLHVLSEKKEDRGIIHDGYIHFIQGKLNSGPDGFFVLKAAIYEILKGVPSVFPFDLPEQVERGLKEPNKKQTEYVNRLNENLIIPIDGWTIVKIIELGREYALQ